MDSWVHVNHLKQGMKVKIYNEINQIRLQENRLSIGFSLQWMCIMCPRVDKHCRQLLYNHLQLIIHHRDYKYATIILLIIYLKQVYGTEQT